MRYDLDIDSRSGTLAGVITLWMAVAAVALISCGSPQPVSSPSTQAVITFSPTQRLDNNEGIDLAISPDGGRIVYVAERSDGVRELIADDFS